MILIASNELARKLQTSQRQAIRIARMLHFKEVSARDTRNSKFILFAFSINHPFILSCALNAAQKPVLSLQEIASIYQWHKGTYSKERAKQKLSRLNIPIQNQSNKGLIYLIHIINAMKSQNNNI